MKRENTRLHRLVTRLESQLKRRDEQLRILEDLVKELEREKGALRAQSEAQKPEPATLVEGSVTPR